MRRFLLVVGVFASLAIVGVAVAATINGTKGNDTIRGTARADVLTGGGGSDTISGLAGNDRINGGPGNDRINGGPGNDRINGGPGNDRINGGQGKDVVFCSAGVDRVQADRLDVVARDCEIVTRPAVPTPPTPPPVGVALRATGPPEVVFDWTNDRCEDLDIPDLSARAFRDASGNVQLISGMIRNRRFIGPDFDHLTHPCSLILDSAGNADPSAFDDNEWIAGTYSPDGQTVYALVHEEYHGWEHTGQCNSPYPDCWYNTITLAVSSDGGATYVDQPQPRVVASVPYRYVPNKRALGIFQPSNIVHNPADNYYYAFVYLNLEGSHVGTCFMRTLNLADPTSWRAWSGGHSFDMSFIDPYRSQDDPNAHLCRTLDNISPGDIQGGSLTYSTVAHQWLWVGQSIGGAYFLLSPDLIDWTPGGLFFPAQVTWDFQCGDPDPIGYPSLIDPDSTSRNFDTVGNTAYLYFTQVHSCLEDTLDRDLVRVPISITK